MSKNFYKGLAITIGILGFGSIAFALPYFTTTQDLIPFVTDTSYIGTSTPSAKEYQGIFTKSITVSGLSSGNCIQAGAGGLLQSASGACGSGGGGSGGGTWATTTSNVLGQLINYPLNNTDIVTVGGNSTTTAKAFFDPNALLNYFSGTTAIGTTSPWGFFSVNPNALGSKVPEFVIGSSTATHFIVDGSGNVGIGTAVPNSGGYTGSTLTISGTNPNNIEFIRNISSGASSIGNFTFGDTSNSTLARFGANSGSSATKGNLIFSTSAGSSVIEAMRIDESQQVGIGTTSPGSLLSVGNTNGINFSTATSTFNSTGGLNIISGCYAISGTCIGSGAGTVTAVTGTYPIQSTGGTAPAISLAFGTTTANTWSGLQTFTNVATTSFTGGLSATYLALTGTSATSTFANGITLTGGCVRVSGACLTANTGTVTSIGASTPNSTLSIGSSPVTTSGTITFDLNLNTANNWSGLQQFQKATSTNLDVINQLAIGGTATTTIFGNATSTFGAGIAGTYLNLTGTTASSTFANGVSLNTGCFAIKGVCITGGSSSSGSGISDPFTHPSYGGVTVSATTTAVFFNNAAAPSLMASTTALIDYATSTSFQTKGTTYLNTTSGNTGIGATTTPSASLDIYSPGGTVPSFAIGSSSGQQVLIKNPTGRGGTWSFGSTTPAARFAIQALFQDTYNNNILLVASSSNNATTTLFQITAGGAIYAPNTGSSGASQTGYWCYDGSGQLIRDSAVCLVSARKFKKDILPLDVGLPELLKLQPVSYYYKDANFGANEQMGFIADDIMSTSPELDRMLVGRDQNGDVHSFNYMQFTALITQAIKDFYGQFQALVARVSGLEQKVNNQQKEIDSLQQQINQLKK